MNREQHERWLLKQGAHPTQIKSRKNKLPKISNKPMVCFSEAYYRGMANSIVGPVYSNTIWDKIQYGETPETIAEIKSKATRCLAPYSKGSLQYLGTNKENLKLAGKKL